MNQLTRFNRVRYTLYSDLFTPFEIPEPEGWENDEKELLRSQTYHGITRNFTNSLRFYGQAFQALKSAYDIRGILADVRIEREERNPQTNLWELTYDATFDFSTYQQEKNYIDINLNESQFFKRVEANMKEKFELERLTDIKGNTIPSLNYQRVELEGREIFRESKLENTKRLFFTLGDDNLQNEYYSIVPSELLYRSDEKFFAPAISISSIGYVSAIGRKLAYTGIDPFSTTIDLRPNSGQVFYLNSNNEKTLNVKVEIEVDVINNQGIDFDMVFVLSIHQINQNISTQIDYLGLQVIDFFNAINGQETSYSFVWQGDITIPERGCLCLSSRNPGITPQIRINYKTSKLTVTQTEPSIITNLDAITLFTAFDRVLQIINGRRCFDSSLLQSQKWQWLMFTNGFKIRNIPEKPLTVSLEELWECINTIDGVAMFIKNNRVSIEVMENAYNTSSIYDLGTPVNISRKIRADIHFSSIEIGYDFNGEYEDVMGLDEFNISNTYKTCIDVNEQEYKSISKVRADAYGVTLAQLKQYINFPKEDTKYDKFNFLLDCKNIGKIVVRRWQDDFTNEPTGIFSPQTAFNLRLSPFNCLLRKAKYLTCGLTKFPNELLTYASTEGNSQLVTIFPEQANIANSELGQPLFLAEEIAFNLVTDLIKFKDITQNKYNLFKFVNEFGDEEFAFALSVQPNNEGNYTMIKANF